MGDRLGLQSVGMKRSNPSLASFHAAPKLGKYGTAGNKFPFYQSNFYRGGKEFGGDSNGKDPTKLPSSGNPIMSGINLDPEMVTDTVGYLTNYRVPYAKLLARFKSGIGDAIQMNQLIVEFKDNETENATRKKNGVGGGPVHVLLNVPIWNYLQHQNELKPKSPQDVISPEEVWDKWSVAGVCSTEEGEDDEIPNSTEKTRDRLLNNITRGEFTLFNTFGPHVRSGTNLYLILKKVKREGSYVCSPIPSKDVENLQGVGRVITDMPYQLEFFGDYRHAYPPPNKVNFKDEFGQRWRGKVIPIGKARTGSQAIEKRNVKRAAINVVAYISQPQIQVFVEA